jgi:hypothetical protein
LVVEQKKRRSNGAVAGSDKNDFRAPVRKTRVDASAGAPPENLDDRE